jgi:hypothetical protein
MNQNFPSRRRENMAQNTSAAFVWVSCPTEAAAMPPMVFQNALETRNQKLLNCLNRLNHLNRLNLGTLELWNLETLELQNQKLETRNS